jgi:hypothetical protein
MMADTKPDVIILTETKLTSNTQDRREIKDILNNKHEIHCSSVDQPKQMQGHIERTRAGSAGVLVAVRKIWTGAASTQRISLANTPLTEGHAVGLKIQPLHSDPLTIWRAYMPFEAAHRAEIDEHLRLMRLISLKDTPFAIVGEDWNATLGFIFYF